jgi:hypothetical protein
MTVDPHAIVAAVAALVAIPMFAVVLTTALYGR